MEEKTNIFITVLVMNKYKGSDKIKEGDIVFLEKELDNEHDANAIMVLNEGEQVGYIANNTSNTVLQDTQSSTDIINKFNKKAQAQIIELKESRGYMKMFRAELIFVKEDEQEKEEEVEEEPITEIEFILAGGITTYPGKTKLAADVKNAPRNVQLVLKKDKIIGKYDNVSAGIVKDKNTTEILTEYIENTTEDVIAKAISVDKGNIVCNIKLNSIIETRKVKLKEIIENIISKGINTKAEIDRKLEYMKKNKVSDIAISSLFETYIEYPEDVRNRIPEEPKMVYVDTTGIVSDAISYMNIGSNLLFEGDKGVGKNVLSETLAWLFNRPLYEFSSNSQHSNNALLGSQTFENFEDDENEKKETAKSFLAFTKMIKKVFFKDNQNESKGEFKNAQKFVYKILNKSDKKLIFEKSSILEAFVNGGIIVLDEFNTSLAHVIPIFNALLDERKRIEITGLGLITGHPNFCAIATQNRDYEGTFEGNEATVDRFEPIIFPPLNQITEVLMEKIPDIDYKTVEIANKLYLTIKASVESGQISDQSLSIRGFISACKVTKQGKSLKDALIKSVGCRVRDLDDRKAIINMIDLQIGDNKKE